MCSEVWNTEGCIWENLVVWAVEKKPSGLLKHGTQESQWRQLELQDNKGKTREKCLLATKVSLFCLLTSVPQRRFSSVVQQRRVSADAWEEHTVVFVKSKRTTRSKRRARYSLDEPLELRCLGWILSHDMNGGAGLASPQRPQTHTHTHTTKMFSTLTTIRSPTFLFPAACAVQQPARTVNELSHFSSLRSVEVHDMSEKAEGHVSEVTSDVTQDKQTVKT